MDQAPQIRRARSGDRGQLLGLWLDLVDYHRALNAAYPPAQQLPSSLESEIDRSLHDESCALLVADIGGQLEGFLFAEIEAPLRGVAQSSPRSWIHELWVTSDRRRRGVASALLERAQVFFREQGSRRFSVRVESANREGMDFWESRGFAERARVLEREEL